MLASLCITCHLIRTAYEIDLIIVFLLEAARKGGFNLHVVLSPRYISANSYSNTFQRTVPESWLLGLTQSYNLKK